MAYKDIQQLDLWRSFFADATPDTYSIYLHSKHSISSSDLTGCVLIPTQPTEWGTFSLVDVQQSLFQKAAEDSSNYKFILLSGDTVPLYSFSKIYAELTKDNQGRMEFAKGVLKYRQATVDKSKWPANIKWEWMYSPQWVILNRDHVSLLSTHWRMLTAVFGKSEIPDEHIYSIFFNGYGYKDTFYPTLMFSTFEQQSKKCSINHRARPRTFHKEELDKPTLAMIYGTSAMFLRKICEITLLNYDWKLEHPLQVPKISDKPEVIPAKRRVLFSFNKIDIIRK